VRDLGLQDESSPGKTTVLCTINEIETIRPAKLA